MGSTTGKVLQTINDMAGLLSQLLAVDLAELPAAEQVQCLQAMRPLVCQVDAVQLRLVGVIDTQGVTRARGSTSTAAWLRNVLRVPNAAAMVRSAAALSALPKVAGALAAGEIDNAHVATIARVTEKLSADVLDGGGIEEVLVAQARQLAPSRFGPVAARIRDQVSPPSPPPPPKPDAASRWLRTCRGPNGNLSVTGMFDPDSGRVLMAALTSATRPPRAGDAQELPARRADALLEICRRGSGGQGEPSSGAEPRETDAASAGEGVADLRDGMDSALTDNDGSDAPGGGPSDSGAAPSPDGRQSAAASAPRNSQPWRKRGGRKHRRSPMRR